MDRHIDVIRVFDINGRLRSLQDLQTDVIMAAIEKGMSKRQIAHRLGIGSSTLYRLIHERGLAEQLIRQPEKRSVIPGLGDFSALFS